MALTDKLSAIGDAIREKTGGTELLTLDAMPTAISSITTGSGGSEDCNGLHVPEEALVITGACDYMFAYNEWNWFIDSYGDRITTKDIISLSHMFFNNTLITSIPFEINCKTNVYGTSLTNMFELVACLETPPIINNANVSDMTRMFGNCYSLIAVPEGYFDTMDWTYIDTSINAYAGSMTGMYGYCYKLKSVKSHPHVNLYITSKSYCYYNKAFNDCRSLKEVIGMPVYTGGTSCWTSNMFDKTFYHCSSLEHFTFATNEEGYCLTAVLKDGTSQAWSNQVIDLSDVGYFIAESDVNSTGYTDTQRVTDASTYAAYKNRDYWTSDIAYSHYNHDSAWETIQTLPDVSTSTYTANNTIKFSGDSGSATDGGAINTLTEEEIAVATEKGWTVTLV